MASVVPAQPFYNDSSSAARKRSWLSEPLVHFVFLGAMVFALDHALVARAGDPNTIVVSADVNKELVGMFTDSRRRPPTPEELKSLQKIWLDNEVLYREGLANGLDRGTRCCAIASSSSRWV